MYINISSTYGTVYANILKKKKTFVYFNNSYNYLKEISIYRA